MFIALCKCGNLVATKGKCRSCYMKDYFKTPEGRARRRAIWNRYRKNHMEYFRKYMRLRAYRKMTDKELIKKIKDYQEKIIWMRSIIMQKEFRRRHGKGSKN